MVGEGVIIEKGTIRSLQRYAFQPRECATSEYVCCDHTRFPLRADTCGEAKCGTVSLCALKPSEVSRSGVAQCIAEFSFAGASFLPRITSSRRVYPFESRRYDMCVSI